MIPNDPFERWLFLATLRLETTIQGEIIQYQLCSRLTTWPILMRTPTGFGPALWQFSNDNSSKQRLYQACQEADLFLMRPKKTIRLSPFMT